MTQVSQAVYGRSVPEAIIISLRELCNQNPGRFLKLVVYLLPYALLHKHSASALEARMKYHKDIEMGWVSL